MPAKAPAIGTFVRVLPTIVRRRNPQAGAFARRAICWQADNGARWIGAKVYGITPRSSAAQSGVVAERSITWAPSLISRREGRRRWFLAAFPGAVIVRLPGLSGVRSCVGHRR
jgi:hypothetical protein